MSTSNTDASNDGTPLFDSTPGASAVESSPPPSPPTDSPATTSPPPEPEEETPEEDATEPAEETELVRVFTVGSKHSAPDVGLDGFNHDGNMGATSAAALNAGYRPSGEVKFVGAELNADGVSVDLTYSVMVSPAATPSAHSATEPVPVAAPDELPEPAPV